MAQVSIPRITLVVGGARSGKSAWAERLAEASGLKCTYIATARVRDGEMASRVAQHRLRRAAHWTTLEVPTALPEELLGMDEPGSVALVDCLTLWLSNLLEDKRNREQEFESLLETLRQVRGSVILVSNEVGLGIVPMNALARDFRDLSGRLNQAVAGVADLAVFMAAGLPLTLKAPEGWKNPLL